MNQFHPECTYAEALRQALTEEMRRDSQVLLMGVDVAVWGNLYGVSRGLLEEFGPDRVKDTPISEAAIAGCGVGAALLGFRPVVEIMYIDFLSIALDQIVNHAAKLPFLTGGQAQVPLVVRTQGGVGLRNACQHSQSLEAWLVHVPGLVVVMPADPADAKGLLASAIRDERPVMCIEHKALYRVRGPVPPGEYLVPLGRARVVRPGHDITVVATSWMVHKAVEAARQLAPQGLEVEVIDPRTLVPLDEETLLSSVKKTGRCLVVHEAPTIGGWGGEVVALIQEKGFDSLDAPVRRLGGLRVPVPYGNELERQVVPDVPDIVRAIQGLMSW